VVLDGRVIAAPNDANNIICLRAVDGDLLWKNHTSDSGPRYLMGVSNGRIVVGGKTVRAFDARTGKALWCSIGFNTSPEGIGLVSEKYAFFPTEGFLYVMDLEGGKLVNRFGILPKSEFGHVSLFGDRLLISLPRKVICYEFEPEEKPGDKGEKKKEGGEGK
jgi:outer membrane protein assembly factor BamB